MDQNSAIVLGGVIAAVVIIAVLMKRIRRTRVRVGNAGEVELGGGTGPFAEKNVQDGKRHKLQVSGPGSEASNNRQGGEDNQIIVGP